MKKIKIEIKSLLSEVLFTYECNDNTIKKTIEKAIGEDADLRGANLRDANLSDADLSDADLRGADLRDAKNKEKSYLPIFCKWSHSIKGDLILIGCKENTIKEWDKFFKSDKVFDTERNTEEFKQIEAVYLANKAYLKHIN